MQHESHSFLGYVQTRDLFLPHLSEYFHLHDCSFERVEGLKNYCKMKRVPAYISVVCILFSASLSFSQESKENRLREAGEAARRDYELERTVDPKTGELPPDVKRLEREYVSHLPSRDPYVSYKSSDPLSLQGWAAIGPRNQPGRTQAIGVDITNNANILVGTASGGVWRSIDRGASWAKVTPPNEVQSVSAIVQDKRGGKTSTWYYSTSELLSTTDRRFTTNVRTHSGGNGIYRSQDNGATWIILPSTQTDGSNTVPINFQGIWNLVTDHKNLSEDVLYAACYGGIMRSSDGGATWARVLGSDSTLCFNSDIVIGTNGTLYAALSSNFGGILSPQQGIWTSKDGIKWEKLNNSLLPTLFRRVKLAVAPSNDSILYVFTEGPLDWTNPDEGFDSHHTLMKFIRTNGSQGWYDFTPTINKMPQDLNSQDGFVTLAGYAMALAVHPKDPDLVLVAGTNIFRSFIGFRDPDAFPKIGGYPYQVADGIVHPDFHVLYFDPVNPDTLFAGTDGGVFTTDGYKQSTPVWKWYMNGLASAQAYDAKLDPDGIDNGLVVTGLQDNSSYLTLDMDPSLDWSVTSGGDGLSCSVVGGENYIITSSQYGYLYLFGIDGLNYTFSTYTNPDLSGALPFAFYTKFIVDPFARNSLFLAQWNNLWRLDDLQSIPSVGQVSSSQWNRFDHVGSAIGDNNVITAFAMPSGSSSKLYIGSSTGKVFRLEDPTDLSSVVTDITPSVFPAGAYPGHIEIDPKDERHMIVVFSNYNVQSIFRTTDGGASWQAISGNLESKPDGTGAGPSVRCVRILHSTGGIVYYAATSSGLFSTNKIDGMSTVWIREGTTTIGNLICENIDVRESDGRVIVATQGGGVFANTGPEDVRTDAAGSSQFLFVEQNYPNPVVTSTRLWYYISKPANVRAELYDAYGKRVALLVDGNFDAGEHFIDLTFMSGELRNLASGAYFYKLTSGSETATKMLVIAR
jgi:hypothetical protein